MNKEIIISIKTILLTFLFIFAGYVFYRLGPVFGIILTSTLIVLAVEPFIKRLMKFKIAKRGVTRSVAVVISYVVLITAFAFIMTVGLPPVVSQFQKMLFTLLQISRDLNITSGVNVALSDLIPQVAGLSGGFLSVTVSVFSNITTLFSILIISIYMSLDWENLKRRLVEMFPDNVKDDISDVVSKIETNIGQWVKGELLLMFVVGLMSLIGLIILGIKYPLALGLIAGLLEVVPILGPIISAILAGIIGFSMAPIKGVGVIVLFVVVQQLENNILVPKIMQKVSGFSPLVILVALLVGSEFFGIAGAILAVPATMVGTIILKRILSYSS